MFTLSRLCCAVDFHDPSTSAFEMAVELGKRFRASLVLLHVDQLPGYTLPDGPTFATAEALSAHRISQSQMMEQLAETANAHGIAEVETVTLLGDPAAEIVRFTQARAIDLVIIGTHGYTGLRHAIMGSVAEKVVRKAHAPVLVVHPTDKSAPLTTPA